MTDSQSKNQVGVMAEQAPRSPEASRIVRNHALAAVATVILPIPVVGIGILVAVHLRMIRQLALLYQVDFSEQRAESLIGTVLGVSATGTAAGLLRLVPGLNLLTALTPSASTYALGKVFIEHFESGGTFLTFDSSRAKAAYEEKLAQESYAGIKP